MAPEDKRRILVVDDDPDIRDALELFLELSGHEVLTAHDGAAALDSLRAVQPPDVILLDLMMPVIDGLEFLGMFRKDPLLASIPVLIATAMPEAAPRELVAGVLAKPFDFDRLLAAIEQLCTGSRLKPAAGT